MAIIRNNRWKKGNDHNSLPCHLHHTQ
jgi:hypothetical protein